MQLSQSIPITLSCFCQGHPLAPGIQLWPSLTEAGQTEKSSNRASERSPAALRILSHFLSPFLSFPPSLPASPFLRSFFPFYAAMKLYCCCQVASVVSNSVQPYRRQPTRLLCPWDCPGKNTGVGCHFLLQCMKVKSESEVAQSCPTLSDPMDCSPPGSSIHGIFRARVLEWGAIAFSVNQYWKKKIPRMMMKDISRIITIWET